MKNNKYIQYFYNIYCARIQLYNKLIGQHFKFYSTVTTVKNLNQINSYYIYKFRIYIFNIKYKNSFFPMDDIN